MEIGVSPLVPSCNRVTIDTAALTIRFADTIDSGMARNDAFKAFEKFNDATGGLEVMAEFDGGACSVAIVNRPGCDADVAGDEAIELFANFVRGSFGQEALDRALNASSMSATLRIRAAKPTPASAMAAHKATIAQLITKLQAQVAALPDDSAKWANVGDAGHIVEQLTELTSVVS